MNKEMFFQKFQSITKIKKDEPMKNHTSFKIGGNAEFMAFPKDENEILDLINICKDGSLPYYIIGNGSNLLVSDNGISGLVIKISSEFSSCKVDGEEITAQAGILLSKLASFALSHSLSGLEFASGIPGTLGGAVVMNAGAYGDEMKDVITKTSYIDNDGNIKQAVGDEHKFSYRNSAFEKDCIVLSSTMRLKRADKDAIQQKMQELNSKRREKQPLELPSAGSTFKRPEGYFAGKLIEDAGLRGYRCGGAMVSDKHCGFVVNYDNATFDDVINVIYHVKNEVYKKFCVTLEEEVKILK